MLSIMVVRYSIGWRGSVERGRDVGGPSSVVVGAANGFEGLGFWGSWGVGMVGVLELSERRRVRPGKAALTWGGGAVRRMERIWDMFYKRFVSIACVLGNEREEVEFGGHLRFICMCACASAFCMCCAVLCLGETSIHTPSAQR